MSSLFAAAGLCQLQRLSVAGCDGITRTTVGYLSGVGSGFSSRKFPACDAASLNPELKMQSLAGCGASRAPP